MNAATEVYFRATEPTSDEEAPSCRGCGGTGVRGDLCPRELQVVSQGVTVEDLSTAGRSDGSSTTRCSLPPIRLSNPYLSARDSYERMLKIGYTPLAYLDYEFPDASVMCAWCHGTGRRRYVSTPIACP